MNARLARRWPPGDKTASSAWSGTGEPQFDGPGAPEIIAAIGDLSRQLGQLGPNVLGAATYQLNAQGQAAEQYKVPFTAVAIASNSAAQLMWTADTLKSQPPPSGPGVAIVPSRGFIVINMRAYNWSIYGGNVGDQVTVTAFTRPLPPVMVPGPISIATATADGIAAQNVVLGAEGLWNGATIDRQRGNIDASPALINVTGSTGTQNSPDQTNWNSRGVKVVLNMTNAGTGSVTLVIQGKDAASGQYYPILTGAAIVANSVNVYTVYPGITAAANSSASDILPRTWRIQVQANNGNPTTYTVGASTIV